MYKIFIVEDDNTISSSLKQNIDSWGFEAYVATDFQNVASEFASTDAHLVLLDLSLPFYNGFYWCTEIRKLSKVPIIFISSASDNMNIVMAMNMGADDFIAKPFDLNVLTAKIQALLRRTYDFGQSSGLITHRDVVLSPGDASLSFAGKKIELTKNELKIMQTLLENNGSIVSRDSLMTALWESDAFVDENTLTVNMTRIRKKLTGLGLADDFIKTKKGIGYIVE